MVPPKNAFLSLRLPIFGSSYYQCFLYFGIAPLLLQKASENLECVKQYRIQLFAKIQLRHRHYCDWPVLVEVERRGYKHDLKANVRVSTPVHPIGACVVINEMLRYMLYRSCIAKTPMIIGARASFPNAL